MNRDDVIRMMREVIEERGGSRVDDEDDLLAYSIQLAALAYAAGAAAMKERAAKVCDEKVDAEYATGKVDHNEMGWTQSCAITIRALGDNDE